MYARHLAAFLSQLSARTDIATRSPADIAIRFERLRGCALLPRGRKKNIQHLSNRQIVAGILSLVSRAPEYAGTATISLMQLQPVGGSAACGFDNLGDAVEALLLDSTSTFRALRVSASEFAENAYCQAAITYQGREGEKTVYFVTSTNITALSPGADLTFDPKPRGASMIVESVFFRHFHRQLTAELERDATWRLHKLTPEPEIDPEEEHEEAEKEARARYLGLLANSSFLNLSVEGQITWPKLETVVDFEGYKLILLPPLIDKAASVHIDLVGARLGITSARTLLERFLSLLTWREDKYSVLGFGWSGNPIPVAVPAYERRMPVTEWWILDRGLPGDEKARKALALYRQGRTAEDNFLVSYAVLSYYKIFELAGHKGEAKRAVASTYDAVALESRFDEERVCFEKICGDQLPADYLWDFCRSAVAHAIGKKNSSDPDASDEIQRLHVAADALRVLARHFIVHQLGVSDSR